MAGIAAVRDSMTFDEAWPILQEEVINRLIHNLEIEGPPNRPYFTSQECMRFYTVVYNVSCSKRGTEVDKLYDQYKRTFEDYISSKVLPSLMGKDNENLLRELLRRWNNHKTMTRWLSRLFFYLSRYHIPTKGLPTLVETSHLAFYNLVYGEIKDQVGDAIISLVDREREGERIEQDMVKQVLDIFKEIGGNAWKDYAENIEKALVKFDAPLYPRKSSNGIAAMFSDHYIHKVKECFDKENARVSKHLGPINKEKVLEVYGKINEHVCAAILSLETKIQIDREHDGQQIKPAAWREARNRIKQAVLKEVQNIFEEICDDEMNYIYAKDIEEALVKATTLFYSRKALDWIETKSYEDYMLKVEECLEKEENIVSQYLKLINKKKQFEVVQHELLDVHANKLERMKAASTFGLAKL